MKKTLCFILTLILISSCFVFAACDKAPTPNVDETTNETAQDLSQSEQREEEEASSSAPQVKQELAFALKSDDTYEVTGIGSFVGDEIMIPSDYKGKAVTGIKELAFFNMGDLLGSLPESTEIPNCPRITSVTIPAGIKTIGAGALSNSGLRQITVDEDNVVYRSESNCIIEKSNTTIVSSCIGGVIPKNGSVTWISNYAFYRCDTLTSIIIPSTITSIGPYAFYGCNNLTSVTIQGATTLRSIGVAAFDCYKLEEINFSGTKAQWNNISKHVLWHVDHYYTIHCTNGDIQD